MLSKLLEACRQELVPREAGVPQWRRETVRSVADVERVIEIINAAMTSAGYPHKEVFAVHLALDEAIINANKHGHQGDWATPIDVRYHVSADAVVAQVEDQGPGFDPDEVADPLAPENLERASGRGLFLMRNYMSGLCYSKRGNCACICEHRHP